MESIRIDPSEIFLGLRIERVGRRRPRWSSASCIFFVQTPRHTGDEPSPYVPGREWKGPDAEVDSDETESDSDSLDDGVEGENSTGETAATSSSRSTTT